MDKNSWLGNLCITHLERISPFIESLENSKYSEAEQRFGGLFIASSLYSVHRPDSRIFLRLFRRIFTPQVQGGSDI